MSDFVKYERIESPVHLPLARLTNGMKYAIIGVAKSEYAIIGVAKSVPNEPTIIAIFTTQENAHLFLSIFLKEHPDDLSSYKYEVVRLVDRLTVLS
jgi:hypothetical protein